MNNITDSLTDVSNFKNPFLKEKVDCIEIEIQKPNICRIHPISATIRFTNGATGGRHKIEGDDLAGVVKQIEIFIESLEKDKTT